MDYTLHKIFDLLWKSNTKERDLCEALGINKSAMTDWKTGKTKSYQRYLPRIAEYFNVPFECLVNIEMPTALDEEQPAKNRLVALVDKISKLSSDDITKTLDYVEMLESKRIRQEP